jgi:hypothetical protein
MKQFTIKHPWMVCFFVLTLATIAGVEHGAVWAWFTAHSLATALLFSPLLGTAVDYTPPVTGTSLETLDPDAVRKIWQHGVDIFEQSEDFFDPMEGGPSALIETITDTSKGKGQKIRFEVMSGFYDEPHMGEELFETTNDFENILIQGNELEVDFMRHATAFTERAEERLGMRGEIISGVNEEIGKWLGRLKTEQLFMMFRETLPSTNIVFAGGATLDTLASTNILKYDEVLGLTAQMKRLGGLPAQTATSRNGQPIWKNCVIATTDALVSLDQDPAFRSILATTRSEEDAKTIFEGGYTNVKGAIIKEYQPIDHDGQGAIGSPLNPKALNGNVITAGTGALTITGGGDPTSAAITKKNYFKYFKNFAYRFLLDNVLSQDSNTYYVMIINPPNDASNPNKWGFYSYTTGNNGNTITTVNRLAGSASGTAVTTLGGVTWNGTNNTTEHPVGALIVQCNRNAQIYGYSLMLGRRAARRGYGKWRNRRTEQQFEGGFITQRFVTSVFGQAPRRDRLQRVPGAFVLCHAMKYAGVSPLGLS